MNFVMALGISLLGSCAYLFMKPCFSRSERMSLRGAANHTRTWLLFDVCALPVLALYFLTILASIVLRTQNLTPKKWARSLPRCVILVFSCERVSFNSSSRYLLIRSFIPTVKFLSPTVPTTQSSAYRT